MPVFRPAQSANLNDLSNLERFEYRAIGRGSFRGGSCRRTIDLDRAACDSLVDPATAFGRESRRPGAAAAFPSRSGKRRLQLATCPTSDSLPLFFEISTGAIISIGQQQQSSSTCPTIKHDRYVHCSPSKKLNNYIARQPIRSPSPTPPYLSQITTSPKKRKKRKKGKE